MTKKKDLVVANILIAICILGAMFTIISSFGYLDKYIKEFPLGIIGAITVDKQGNIYVGSETFDKVQVYDQNGKFLKGWSVDTRGSSFKLKTDENGNLLVASAKAGRFYVFDSNGELLVNNRDGGKSYDELVPEKEKGIFVDSEGNRYEVGSSIFYPIIYITNSSGEQKKLISTPFYKWVFTFPHPASEFFLIAFFINLWNRVMYPNNDKKNKIEYGIFFWLKDDKK